jgi:hypothetical protein
METWFPLLRNVHFLIIALLRNLLVSSLILRDAIALHIVLAKMSEQHSLIIVSLHSIPAREEPPLELCVFLLFLHYTKERRLTAKISQRWFPVPLATLAFPNKRMSVFRSRYQWANMTSCKATTASSHAPWRMSRRNFGRPTLT